MSGWTPEQGAAEAERRIRSCGEARADELDLGGLGLRAWPEGLRELTWLKTLWLGEARIEDYFVRYPWLRASNSSYGPNGRKIIWFGDDAFRRTKLSYVYKENLENWLGPPPPGLLDRFTQLKALDLCDAKIGDEGASALSALRELTTLDLRRNKIGVEGARALSTLSGLNKLDLGENKIGAEGARALSVLRGLTTLDLYDDTIGDEGARALSALENLTTLILHNNGIGIYGARALSALTGLTKLDLGANKIGSVGARALSEMSGLTTLDLFRNYIEDGGARALSSLDKLTTLDLWDNWITASGARALSSLTRLTTLVLTYNKIGDEGARALSSLSRLTTLDLSGAGVTDLTPFEGMTRLETLGLGDSKLAAPFETFWFRPSLREVNLQEPEVGSVPGVPAELLEDENCLPALRAHFADLRAGRTVLRDVKLMLLGNGRVGKTQIANRLRDRAFEAVSASTHGVRIASVDLAPTAADGAPDVLKIWDFGGQDIYLGTHALFLRSRAMFAAVWAAETETEGHSHDDLWFRNFPLDYWVRYVAQMSGPRSPLVIVQTRCDDARAGKPRPPLADPTLLDRFAFVKPSIHFSAKTDRGRAALEEALREAAAFIREESGEIAIGAGRLAVKQELDARRERASAGKSDLREDRWITREEFDVLCGKDGRISDAGLLLDYLHQIGTVFYDPRLFGGRIVIDQQWALDAIYAVFDRDSGLFKRLRDRQAGRFTPSDLAEAVWRDHGPEAQALFLSMMRSCGICFWLRAAEAGGEAVYVAPDLLPEKAARGLELAQKWEDGAETLSAEHGYAFLPPGLMRAVMAKIGEEAGLAADYWRGGLYVFETGAGARAMIEERADGKARNWAGAITIRTQKGDAAALLSRLERTLERLEKDSGVEAVVTRTRLRAPEPRSGVGGVVDAVLGRSPVRRAEPLPPAPARRERDADALPTLSFGQEPADGPERYVSYAWGGDATPEERRREKVVDRLCELAGKRGLTILRDREVMTHGDSILRFMDRMVRSDGVVYVVLSVEYFRSAFCMYELYHLWLFSRKDERAFRRRVKLIRLPDAAFDTLEQRDAIGRYWADTYAEQAAIFRRDPRQSDRDFKAMKHAGDFASHVRDILAIMSDMVAQNVAREEDLVFE